jgi:hypothetical protein
MLKKSRNYVAMLLALVMCVSSLIPAFASVAADKPPVTPVKVEITKDLRMPVGTTTPSATFEFEAKAISRDGNAPTEMPELKNLSITFDAGDEGENASEDEKSVVKPSGDILAGVIFEQAGVYVYEITEKDKVPSIDSNKDEELWYSGAKYTLTIYVENIEDGGTYAKAVIAKVVTLDTEPDPEDEEPLKPGDKVEVGQGDGGMIFTNTYLKTFNVEEPDPVNNPTLSVSNEVSGPLADLLQDFEYKIDMSSYKIHPEMFIPNYYRAYIVDPTKENPIVDPSENADSILIGDPGEGALKYIKIASEGETAFTLKHGQSLVFVDTPVGTKYEVTQTWAKNYKTSYTRISNDDKDNIVSGNGEEEKNISTEVQIVGNPINLVAFANARQQIDISGLSLNNLHFMLMLIFGLGCLGAYVVVGTRRRASVKSSN